MADEDSAHAQTDAHCHKNDQHRHRQHDLGHDNGHIDHHVDKALGPKLELFQPDPTQNADGHADQGGQHGDDQRIEQRVPQVGICKGEQLTIPLGGKPLPVVVSFGVVEGK